MRSNMKVRTRQLVVVAPLLIAVVVGAGFVVIDQLALANDYGDDAELIELASTQTAFASSIATESVYAVIGSAGDESAITLFETSADAANDDWDDLALASQTVVERDETLDEQLVALDDQFGRIVDLRTEILAGTADPADSQAEYEALDDALTTVESAAIDVAQRVETLEALNGSQRLSEVSQTIGDIGRAAAVHVVDPSDGTTRDLRERLGVYRHSNSWIQSSAVSDLTARYETLITDLNSPAATALAEGTTRDVLDSGVGEGEALLSLSATVATLHGELLEDAGTDIDGLRDGASDMARNFGLAALLGLLASGAMSVLFARSITNPLRRLNKGATRLAAQDLPKLVEQVQQTGAAEPFADYALPVESNNEVGRLAESINSISEVTMSVATSQSEVLRTGIVDIFVHLARRNQGLLDRQIELIDELEARERDPAELENLYRLDHLATRMRRNAESLMVMAGVQTPRRSGTSIGLVEVLRVAAGEVEDFERIELTSIDHVDISGVVAVDLAHLVSELMENATQFSAPDTKIEIRAGRGQENEFKITIADHGIGMAPEECRAANQLLADPPLIGVELSRSLGLSVVARLAARIDTEVTLLSSEGTGTVATVTMPNSAISPSAVPDRAPSSATPSRPPETTAESPPEVPAKPARTARPAPTPVASVEPTMDGAPAEAGRSSPSRSESATRQPRRSTPTLDLVNDSATPASPGFRELAEFMQAQGASAPEAGSQGASSRVRGATAMAPEEPGQALTPTKRSPEEVRRLLSRYQAGLHNGRASASSEDDQEEGVPKE